jgi:hypothetical protein
MKFFDKIFKIRLELKEKGKYIEVTEVNRMLQEIPKLLEKISKEHGAKNTKTFLKGAIDECLQLDLLFETYFDEQSSLVKINDDIAENIVNSVVDLFLLQNAKYTGFIPKSKNNDTNKIVFENINGNQMEFNMRLVELYEKEDISESVENFMKVVKQAKSITNFKILDEYNNLKSTLDTAVIPDETHSLEGKEEELLFTSLNTQVLLLRVPLTGNSNANWEVSFTPKQPENVEYYVAGQEKMNVTIKDADFQNLIKQKEVSFKHGDIFNCDITIQLEKTNDSLGATVKKATIFKVYV